jgi:hypothetical protein
MTNHRKEDQLDHIEQSPRINVVQLLENQDTCINSPSLCNLDKPISEPRVLPPQAPNVFERSSFVDLLHKVSLILDAPRQFPYLPQRRTPCSQSFALGPDLQVDDPEGGNHVELAATTDRPSLGKLGPSIVCFQSMLSRPVMPFRDDDS